MSCRTLAYLDCPKDGKVLAKSGICPECKQQLYQFKPLAEEHTINGRKQKHNNTTFRGVESL